jgi:hypothetical protein
LLVDRVLYSEFHRKWLIQLAHSTSSPIFNVEICFLMLALGSTLGISFHFCLESLCRAVIGLQPRFVWFFVKVGFAFEVLGLKCGFAWC